MKPDSEESLNELLTWYANVYTPQMLNGQGSRPEVMIHNLSVLRDAVNSYRTWRSHAAPDEPNPYIETRPPEDAGQLFERGYALIHGRRPGELERPDQINIDARHAVIHQRPDEKTKYARCGNCGTRYEITDDSIENHHRAMRHKAECGKGSALYTEGQRRDLLDDFNNQPMQVAFRERAAAELAAGADPGRLQLTGVDIFAPAPERPQLPAATWPDGSPVKTPTGPLMYSETRNPKRAPWWTRLYVWLFKS